MLLYIHVPFCRKKCAYCAFFSVPLSGGTSGATEVKEYLAALLGEMRFWSGLFGKQKLETVFFGGGTPSLLPAKAIEGILNQTAKLFTLNSAAEISIEANPESALAEGWLFDAHAAGVNRLSLGVQSFNGKSLSLLGRCHDAREAEAAYHTARSAGFTNISLDFMWGLPSKARPQAQQEWLEELRRAVRLKPEHISTYSLTLETGTPLKTACDARELALPGEESLGSMYMAGADYLEENGYMQYEISNFARMGHACRHNLGYWQGRDYLGLGPAATSTVNGKRWTNPDDIAVWRHAVAKETLGNGAEDISGLVELKEKLMLSLRMNRGLNLQEWKKLAGRPFLKDYANLVKALRQNGLAAVRQGQFRLTRSGLLVSDAVLAHFFARMESFNLQSPQPN